MNNALDLLAALNPTERLIFLIAVIVIAGFAIGIAVYRLSGKISVMLESIFVVRRQLENDHANKPGVKENLREEVTENHETTNAKLDRVLKLSLINADGIASLTGLIGDLTGRVTDIEDTQRRETLAKIREEINNG